MEEEKKWKIKFLMIKDYYIKNKMNILSFKVISWKLILKWKIKIYIVNYDLWYTPDMEEVYEIFLALHSYQNSYMFF